MLKNKWFVAIIAAIAAVALAVGGIFIVKAVKANNQAAPPDGVNFEIFYLEQEYLADDEVVFKVKAYGEKELTSIRYSFDNGEEIEMRNCRYGATDETASAKGKNYVESGVVTLKLSEMSGDVHLLTFYVYEGNNKIAQLGETKVIKIKQ